MKKLFPYITAALVALLSTLSVHAINYYPSGTQEGQIGTTSEKPIDDPADNVFHIQIDDPITSSDRVWLTYELDGVVDHHGVAHSLNDQLAQGGYLVSRRQGYVQQREMVSASWLVQGDNVLRFTLPNGAKSMPSRRALTRLSRAT